MPVIVIVTPPDPPAVTDDGDMLVMVGIELPGVRAARLLFNNAMRSPKINAAVKANKMDNQTWNRRYRQYMEKIRTGSPYEIAAVLRDLYQLKFDKDLSFGERKMLDTAKSFLIKEISLAKNVDEQQIEQEISDIFGSC